MSDIFTLKFVPVNSELGMALKNFRIEKKITAKSIINYFGKSSSYISKLEKGDIKKINSNFLIELCNYISESDNGITEFLQKTVPNFPEYSTETKIIIMNIDDLVIEHSIPEMLITEIQNYLNKHRITSEQLADKINANDTIKDLPGYKSAPTNEWYTNDNDIDNSFIKLSIPSSYIDALLSQKVSVIHSVIAEAILYAMYRLSMDDERQARELAHSKLTIYNIPRIRGGNFIAVNDSNVENLFGGLEPDVAKALKGVTSGLKIITTLTQKNGYGCKKIKQIDANMKNDIGFYFAYMSLDLEKLEGKNKDKKQEFLNELKILIDKFSQDDSGLDLYD